MALRTTAQTSKNDYGTRFPTAKSYYDKVKPAPRPPLGSLNNAKLQRDQPHKALKSKLPAGVLRPVAVKKEEPVFKVPPPKEKHVSPIVEDMEIAQVTQQFSEQLHIEDIDSVDADNPQLCSEYVKDIYSYMGELERKFHVAPTYMQSQPQINARMRTILVDWLVQVHLKFNLLQETLYLTISIMDRYLAKQEIPKSKLQLVGVTAMLVASKYEEMYAPEVKDFVYITDKLYTSGKILQMEMHMLQELDYSFGNPLCLHFLRRYSRAGEATPKIHTMAKFLMELCLPDYTMLEFLPSMTAAAALNLAIKVYGNREWTPALHHYSTYSEADIMPCMRKMCSLLLAMPTAKQQAVYKKYSGEKFLSVARNEVLQGPIIRTLAAQQC